MNRSDLDAATRLVTRAFGLEQDAIVREAMDHEWAPVERWHLLSDRPDVPPSVVVKSRRHGETGWGGDRRNLTAERRALGLLGESGLVPRTFASSDEPGVIVMEDLRDAPTVERILFADDPAAAWDALLQSAVASGRMHAATTPIDPLPWNPAALLMTGIDERWTTLIRAVQELGLPAPHDAEIGALAANLDDRSWWALTHSDANPSNVLVTGNRTILIDFEGANPRHIAIDGAGFALAFPAYRYWADLPTDVTGAMTDAWRQAITPAFPAAADDEAFGRMLAAGALAWTIARLTRLPRIADASQPPAETHRRRSQIVHTVASAVAVCAAANAYPGMTQWLAELDATLRRRWPEASFLRTFPAFSGGSRDGWEIFHDI
jgi:hypothetical protein